jgi:hypothetical protein
MSSRSCWRSGVVIDRLGRVASADPRPGSAYQQNLQLLAGYWRAGGASAGSGQATLHRSGGAVLALYIPRFAGGSTPADGPTRALHARGSAVRPRRCGGENFFAGLQLTAPDELRRGYAQDGWRNRTGSYEVRDRPCRQVLPLGTRGNAAVPAGGRTTRAGTRMRRGSVRVRKSGASSATRRQPNVQGPSSTASSSDTRMSKSPSYPTPTSMRSSATTYWSISSIRTRRSRGFDPSSNPRVSSLPRSRTFATYQR